MKRRLSALLVGVAVAFALCSTRAAAAPATKAEIATLVSAATSYQAGQSREALQRLEKLAQERSSGTRKQVEAGLIELLGANATYEAREFACTQLGIMGSKTVLPALAKLLTNEDTAGIACLALTTYPRGKADDILRTALASAPSAARIQIINTLGDRRDSKAVKVLSSLAQDGEPSVAKAAIAALGKIGDSTAWKALIAIAQNADGALQAGITEATLRCAAIRAASGDVKAATALYEGVLAGSQPVYVRRAALDALLRLKKENAQQQILDILHSSDAALKPIAIANVRRLPSANASGVFAAELPKLSPAEQVWMIDSLATRGDAAATTAIGDSLASPDAAVRREAIEALGRVGNVWCVPLFKHSLDRARDSEERRAIESALIDLPGGKQADLAIAKEVKNSSGETRAALITAIARREGPIANLLLLAESRQPDVPVAKAALRALAKTATPREVSPLLERLTGARDPQIRLEAESAVAQAIPRIENPGRRSALVRDALGWAQGPESRVALIGLLPACGDEAALISAKAAAANSDSNIRNAAVRALADWPNAAAWESLAGIYRQPPSESTRAIALRGLVRLAGEENAHPSPALVAHYRLLLDGAHSPADLRLILGALGGATQPEALQLALPLLARPEVRAEAEVAVKRIAEAVKATHPKLAEDALKQANAKP